MVCLGNEQRKTQQWPQNCKRSVFIPIPKKGNAKECSNYRTIALISHISEVMLKIHQVRLQLYVNSELPDVQVGFRKGRGTRDQTAKICWIIEKATEFRKPSTSALLNMPKPLTVWITTNCGKFFKRWEYQTTLPASWETCVQVRKQQLELDMEQWTSSKLRKEYVKAVYCHPAYSTYMQSTSWEIPGWMKHKLEIKIARRNINNLRYADDCTLMAESEEELKSLLVKVKEKNEKADLKLIIQKKQRLWHLVPSLYGK